MQVAIHQRWALDQKLPLALRRYRSGMMQYCRFPAPWPADESAARRGVERRCSREPVCDLRQTITIHGLSTGPADNVAPQLLRKRGGAHVDATKRAILRLIAHFKSHTPERRNTRQERDLMRFDQSPQVTWQRCSGRRKHDVATCKQSRQDVSYQPMAEGGRQRNK